MWVDMLRMWTGSGFSSRNGIGIVSVMCGVVLVLS